MAEASIYEIHDPRFRQMIVTSAGLDELYSGCRWAEGPVWFNDANQLLWSDIPNQRMLRWTPESGVSVYRQPSNFTNGHTRDRLGRLISCEHGARRVTRTEIDGSITVLADRFEGARLNSPNDVVVKSDGSIWFTDPTYGIMSDYEGYRAEPEQATRNVYRLDPTTGALSAVVTDFIQPNGLAFSPDETILYVADSAASHDESLPRHIRAFDVIDGIRLANGRVFCLIDNGIPDGIRTDVNGNLWSSAADGVHCFDPAGTLIGKIRVPQTVANLTFGGPQRNRLFIAATRSVYSVYVAVSGAQVP
ncbi:MULTISPECIES: SMP-30/gluconolactonase/LRE family protein [Rhizobium]|jgi:gluconolactonase|uniref:SMP-30/gluconolactonase/LRE family protein n=1 Tax=Rhizobium TaxID=379 RepID=UPI000363E47D|nr:SMP-30/gluconolactonase/LRE family protein [Rhizobium leguminosarum]MBY2908701.1 SMP-30/gluconolactonase/LRE family protein [Rhizobium leguminosarum]MBY2942727.1 SMP-30/gluconolactonase/LRE family protein [Rhizobium leguminosarum]MBY2963818.1 SMP-30/gluconolactonase/LRE family protein [Rhizobium leguminosarum]MBY2987773.1 SMP-30/gluconolactonase/LRE family protein [Rhizobium leguminosarum]MBY2991854.1 SMP-30/gluconolactonase/LRE family protein [Rhizobium leguminosarum]